MAQHIRTKPKKADIIRRSLGRNKTFNVIVYRKWQLGLEPIGKFKVFADSPEGAVQEGWLHLFLKAEPASVDR